MLNALWKPKQNAVRLTDADAQRVADDVDTDIVGEFRRMLVNENSASFDGTYRRGGLTRSVSPPATGRTVRGFVFGEILITRPDGREYRSYLHTARDTAYRAAKGV